MKNIPLSLYRINEKNIYHLLAKTFYTYSIKRLFLLKKIIYKTNFLIFIRFYFNKNNLFIKYTRRLFQVILCD